MYDAGFFYDEYPRTMEEALDCLENAEVCLWDALDGSLEDDFRFDIPSYVFSAAQMAFSSEVAAEASSEVWHRGCLATDLHSYRSRWKWRSTR